MSEPSLSAGASLVVCFGLTTLDHLQIVEHVPAANEKVTSLSSHADFGGPAANAAATVVALGGVARLVTACGSGHLSHLVLNLVKARGIAVRDLLESDPGSPAISTVLVTKATGERAVISANASGVRSDLELAGDELVGARALVVDGHHMPTAIRLAQLARDRGVPVVFDGGSWKSGTDDLLRRVDVAVVSADFHPPGDLNALDYLRSVGCPRAAQSHGPDPTLGYDRSGDFKVRVPQVADVVDTLGAGDVLHGALTHYLAQRGIDVPLSEALQYASAIASESCRHTGPHGWIDRIQR